MGVRLKYLYGPQCLRKVGEMTELRLHHPSPRLSLHCRRTPRPPPGLWFLEGEKESLRWTSSFSQY